MKHIIITRQHGGWYYTLPMNTQDLKHAYNVRRGMAMYIVSFGLN